MNECEFKRSLDFGWMHGVLLHCHCVVIVDNTLTSLSDNRKSTIPLKCKRLSRLARLGNVALLPNRCKSVVSGLITLRPEFEPAADGQSLHDWLDCILVFRHRQHAPAWLLDPLTSMMQSSEEDEGSMIFTAAASGNVQEGYGGRLLKLCIHVPP